MKLRRIPCKPYDCCYGLFRFLKLFNRPLFFKYKLSLPNSVIYLQFTYFQFYEVVL